MNNSIACKTVLRTWNCNCKAIRRTYNAAVTDYNNTIEMFPSSVVARQQGHHQEELIDIPEPEQQNVNVAELLR